MSRTFLLAVLASLLLGSISGCANLFGFSASNTDGSATADGLRTSDGLRAPDGPTALDGLMPSDGLMTPARMETIFGDQVDAIVGTPGAIQTRVDGIIIYLLSDPNNDRMRLVAAVASATSLRRRDLGVLLQANFDRTLDARYAISDGVVYSVYQHRISSLTPAQIKSALAQIVSLAKTFGTGFSAAGLAGLDGSSLDVSAEP